MTQAGDQGREKQLKINMANFFEANLTNVTKMSSTADDEAKVPLGIIINSIACPFTVVLNVQVIMAVKTRPRLRTNSNILLTCLAVTDALTGLTVQPLFVLGRILRLFDVGDPERVAKAHNTILFVIVTSSLLHLMLVTFERLIAIKFTMHYSNVITRKNLKLTVGAFWGFSFICGAMWQLNFRLVLYFCIAPVLVLCILFVTSAYVVLYRETLRHRKMIKTHQLPQGEVEKFTKENKALKTTVFVIGAVVVCFLPAGVSIILHVYGVFQGNAYVTLTSWIRTSAMYNSLVNPLIYCWRQKEMRKAIFCSSCQVVDPANQ